MDAPPTARSDPLPFELEDRLRGELAPGERLAWSGQPDAGRSVLWAIPIAVLGIPFTAFAVFWSVTASRVAGPLQPVPVSFFTLFGIPFVLIGLGMLASPLWAWHASGRTLYALTDRRALISTPGLFGGNTVRSFGPESLDNLTRVERGDGSGDLIFQERVSYHRNGHRRVARIGFLALRDVRAVEDLLRKTLSPR